MSRISSIPEEIIKKITLYYPPTHQYPSCVQELQSIVCDYQECQKYFCKWQRLSCYKYILFFNNKGRSRYPRPFFFSTKCYVTNS